jgi:hypothetical protein
MKMKSLLVVLMGMAIAWGGWTLPAHSQGTAAGQAYPLDPETSALMLRKGKESFSRARYGEAKDYFRKAIQADPNSQKAWSYYDLAQLYAVAEQVKNHGRVVASTAPAPEQTAELTAAPPAAPIPPKAAPVAPLIAPAKEKAAPVKKGKTAPAVKEKPTPSTEVKKPGEPAKPAVSAPAPPATPATPSTAPPAPTKPPGGAKILQDEGC